MSNEITDTAQQIARELRAVLARTDWAGEEGRVETEWQEAASPERVNALCAALLQSEPLPTQAMCRAAVEYMNGADVYAKLPRDVLEIEEGIYREVWRAMALTPNV